MVDLEIAQDEEEEEYLSNNESKSSELSNEKKNKFKIDIKSK